MTTICKHLFVDQDGYCPNCGETIRTVKRGQLQRKVTQTVAKKVQTDFQEHMRSQNEYLKIARETIELLASIYDADVNIQSSQRMGATHMFETASSKHTINFGIPFLKEVSTDGFVDYRANWIVSRKFSQKPIGADAVKLVAAHEFAHVLQTRGGFRVRGVMHGTAWEHFYKEIIDLLF